MIFKICFAITLLVTIYNLTIFSQDSFSILENEQVLYKVHDILTYVEVNPGNGVSIQSNKLINITIFDHNNSSVRTNNFNYVNNKNYVVNIGISKYDIDTQVMILRSKPYLLNGMEIITILYIILIGLLVTVKIFFRE